MDNASISSSVVFAFVLHRITSIRLNNRKSRLFCRDDFDRGTTLFASRWLTTSIR